MFIAKTFAPILGVGFVALLYLSLKPRVPETEHECQNVRAESPRTTPYPSYSKLEEKLLEDRFQSRRQQVQNVCRRVTNKEDVRCTIESRLLFFWAYRISVCTMGKVGSGTWRGHAQVLGKEVGQHKIRGGRRSLLKKPWDFVTDYTKSLNKWITVRHPLARLVSAFQDKFYNGSGFPKMKSPLTEFLFPALLSNRLAYRDWNSQLWKEFSKGWDVPDDFQDKSDPRLSNRVTFPEFLTHVVRSFKDGTINRHWKPYGLLCSPCYFEYDYITKLETQEVDLEYLFDKFALPLNAKRSGKVKEDAEAKINKDLRYFKEVPRKLKQSIYNIYKVDMEMFGYDLPDDFWD